MAPIVETDIVAGNALVEVGQGDVVWLGRALARAVADVLDPENDRPASED